MSTKYLYIKYMHPTHFCRSGFFFYMLHHASVFISGFCSTEGKCLVQNLRGNGQPQNIVLHHNMSDLLHINDITNDGQINPGHNPPHLCACVRVNEVLYILQLIVQVGSSCQAPLKQCQLPSQHDSEVSQNITTNLTGFPPLAMHGSITSTVPNMCMVHLYIRSHN